MNLEQTFEEILRHFNAECGTRLLPTDKKKKQLQNRLKLYTIEEIKKAIEKRCKLEWYCTSGFYKDWDSLFRNDEKIERILNLTVQKQYSQEVEQKARDYHANTGRMATEELKAKWEEKLKNNQSLY